MNMSAPAFKTDIVHNGYFLTNRELDAILSSHGITKQMFIIATILGDYDLKDAIFEICNFNYK